MFFYIILGCVVLGLAFGFHDYWKKRQSGDDGSGWIYFMTAPARTDAPIKVGMTRRDPTEDRMPEIRTMSPFPLRVIYKVFVDDRYEAERAVHAELAQYRQQGEWFDREATLALISHLKGEH